MKKQRAFTLPEMLAVIALIIIVISMLLPAFVQARHIARVARCEQNHHTLMTGFRVYVADNKMYLPFTNWLSQDAAWRDQGGAGWLYKYPASTPNPFTEEHREGGALWKLVNKEASVYRCPLDAPPYDTGPTHAITSYLVNGAISGFGQKLPAYRSFEFKSQAMFMWEVDDDAPANYYNDGSSYPDERITRRHGDGLTISFIDGHSEWVKYNEYQEELKNTPGRIWCNPGSPTGRW